MDYLLLTKFSPYIKVMNKTHNRIQQFNLSLRKLMDTSCLVTRKNIHTLIRMFDTFMVVLVRLYNSNIMW
jgi:hypothetical protein